jgi:hypothetical protein
MTTTATEVTENTVIGKALYLELVPTDTTADSRITQVLITPEAFDHKGNFVRMALHSRTVSPTSPRKQWRINFTDVNNKELIVTNNERGLSINPLVAQELAVKMITRFESSLAKQVSYKFAVRNKPIVVEVSALDLSEIGQHSTPQALMRRLQKARVACGFPEKLV